MSTKDWELVNVKQVYDSDGFLTDYAWYRNGDKNIFMFGDKDIVEPDEDYADWETDSGVAAAEWFAHYNGFEDELDDEDDLWESVNTLEPRQRTGVDGKTWWVVFDTATNKYSTLTYFGKYKTKKDCQQAIDNKYNNVTLKENTINDILKDEIKCPLCGSLENRKDMVFDKGNGRICKKCAKTRIDNTNTKLDEAIDKYYVTIELNSSHAEYMHDNDYNTAMNTIKNAIDDFGVKKIRTWFKDFYIGTKEAVYAFTDRCFKELDDYFWLVQRPLKLDDELKKELNITDESLKEATYMTSFADNMNDGYIFTYCPVCGTRNRVLVHFPGFDKPFETADYTCEYCGTKNRVYDKHKYDDNGNIIDETLKEEKDRFGQEIYKNWEDEDIILHKEIDWTERNYRDYPVEEDSFMHKAIAYGFSDGNKEEEVKFIKYLRANPIYPPYYAPEEKPFDKTVGPMYDGRKHGKYSIHDRYETQDLYDMLSESHNKELNEMSPLTLAASAIATPIINKVAHTVADLTENEELNELFPSDSALGMVFNNPVKKVIDNFIGEDLDLIDYEDISVGDTIKLIDGAVVKVTDVIIDKDDKDFSYIEIETDDKELFNVTIDEVDSIVDYAQPLTLDEDYEFTYSVDGKKETKTINAPSMMDAEKKLKDETVSILDKKEVKENDISEDDIEIKNESLENETIGDTTPEPASPGTPLSTANIISALIQSEWQAIDDYNSAIVTLADIGMDNIVNVLKDIIAEENIHVGQLQAALLTIAPNAAEIANGEEEAEEQLNSASDENINNLETI